MRYAGNLSHQREPRRRCLRVLPDHRLRSDVQAGARIRGGAVSAGADPGRALTPGLLDGYGFNQYIEFDDLSAACSDRSSGAVTDRLRVLPGLRFNYDGKDVDFDQQVYGGLQTTDPALIALQRSVFAPQAYADRRRRHESVGTVHGRLSSSWRP